MLIRTLTIIPTTIILTLTSPLTNHFNTTPTTTTETTTTETTDTVDDYGIYGADTEAETVITDTINRFAAAGLPLPELRIYVHDTNQPCHGHQGLYSKGADLNRIDLCDLAATTHELAHAWEHHHLTDTTRQTFMNTYNIDTWNDPDTIHAHRGIEQVAFAITWGLTDQPVQAMLADHYTDELARYQLLTGTASPRLQPPTNNNTTPTIDIDPTDINITTNSNFG